jgi:hypothetical protein
MARSYTNNVEESSTIRYAKHMLSKQQLLFNSSDRVSARQPSKSLFCCLDNKGEKNVVK